jgi:hypothetical protein
VATDFTRNYTVLQVYGNQSPCHYDFHSLCGTIRGFSDLGVVRGLGCVSVAGLRNPTFGNEVPSIRSLVQNYGTTELATDEHGSNGPGRQDDRFARFSLEILSHLHFLNLNPVNLVILSTVRSMFTASRLHWVFSENPQVLRCRSANAFNSCRDPCLSVKIRG